MCWICDKHAQSSNLTGNPSGANVHLAAADPTRGGFLLIDTAIDSAPMDFIRFDGFDFGRATDGMIGTGHNLVPPQVGALIVVPDNIPGDTNTTATLTIGTPVISTTNTIGDLDFYKVTLQAGQRYEIGMYAKDGGPNGVAHADCYIELYGPDGELIVSADGGASTIRNNINSGFDVLLVYTPKESGTFYVNARAYDQDPINGTDGDFVGDYELFVRLPESNYKPYYDVDSPLYAIDWGSQVDRTSRNPDGQEGPRVTGNEFTGVGANPFGIVGKNVITYYYARQGDVFVNPDPVGDPLGAALTTTVAWGMEDWEKGAFRVAMDNFEAVADVVFVEVQTRNEADFVYITYNGTPNAGILGRMSPPNENAEGQAEFNRNGPGWTEAALVEGGFSFITLIHEMGHGMGLSHPHDNGGRSGIMRGVEPETGPGGTPEPFNYTHGDFSLNQGIYTMMSYESGWEESPYGQASSSAPYGWDAGPMAFDIAALQDKYGVNEDWRTGNDTYVLKDANAKGTFYKAIWDAGGTDEIVYSGSRNTVIDLRAATLQYETGGGGFLSYAYGIHGGYTIANGVTIENASSGSGNDTITGNAARNRLSGGLGNDTIDGGAEFDLAIFSGNHADSTWSRAPNGQITVTGTDGTDTLKNIERLEFADGTIKFTFDFGPAQWSTASAAGGWNVGDFNGDGKDDIFRYFQGTSGADMFLSNGSAFQGVGSWTTAGNGIDGKWHIGDFNGDGKDDIFRYMESGSVLGADMFLSNGGSFDRVGTSWSTAGIGTDGKWYIGDFNGDGKDDVFRYMETGSVLGADMFLSSGSSFDRVGTSWSTAGIGTDGQWHIGDFNGDGMDDIFRYMEGTGEVGVDVFLSNGSGFDRVGIWTTAGIGTDGQWHIGDFNGDGKDDILRYMEGQSGGQVFLSTGTAFELDGSWTSAGNGIDGTWHIGDFTGDGNSDLMRVMPNGVEVLI